MITTQQAAGLLLICILASLNPADPHHLEKPFGIILFGSEDELVCNLRPLAVEPNTTSANSNDVKHCLKNS